MKSMQLHCAARWIVVIALALQCGVAAAAGTKVPPLSRYNSIAETTYLLGRCGQLSTERREWLMHLIEHAMRPLDWTQAQWEAHDVALTRDFDRLHPTVPPERCAELARTVDHERRTTPRAP